MMKINRIIFIGVLLFFYVFSICHVAAEPEIDKSSAEEPTLPIVFIHGFNGSAAQYETQAMRWASNNYPNIVTGIDRISSEPAVFYPMLDEFFDAVLAETGDSQIYAVAHSLGTYLMLGYLNSTPERSARIAKYINIDGIGAYACPGNPDPIPCLNIARNPATTMGPNNIHPVDYGHTQAVTSAESFVWQYKFLMKKEPETTFVLPEPPGQVEIAGRAFNYPYNTGIEGATLQLWEVNCGTGVRKYRNADAETILDATGNFGPWPVNGQQCYELNVIRHSATGVDQRHFYYEPFIRSDYLLRLNNAPPDSILSNAIWENRGPHTGVSIVRMKEWWGENPVNPENVDSLYITSTTPSETVEAGNVVTGGTAPYTASTISMIAFDIGGDGTTDTDALLPLGPFLAGLDVYMPAVDPPNGFITFASEQRPTHALQMINTPNWSMDAGHFMTVTFRDWTQEIHTWGECRRVKPSPCK